MPHGFRALLALFSLTLMSVCADAQTGSIHEPVRYIGGPVVAQNAHDSQLRPAIGVENIQVMRANRSRPELSDMFGWTYNHGPNLIYWNNRYYIHYLSNPVGEHIAPGQTLLCSSLDGRTWGTPQVIFPIYELHPPDEPGTAMMHQRMGFYIAPDGRLLLLGFYGHAPNPFQAGGIGRVVRELHKDQSFGPIYFIRYNEASGWGENNTRYPHYTRSNDAGFVASCESLLNDKLMRIQWFDEEGLDNDAFSIRARNQPQAFNWFHRKDGTVVGLFKWSLAALSTDNGQTWSEPVKCPTLQMTGAKISGRATSDGRYALIYNPNVDDDHRWPLAIVTSDDGILFDNMLCVHGEVPPRRFNGKYKDFGPQYNRCVEEGNGATPGPDLWVTYSMNKEDIWVSRIPVPVRDTVTGPVADTFDNLEPGGPVTDWNIYSPAWAPVKVQTGEGSSGQVLDLHDHDPYDYARATRVFQESTKATIEFKARGPRFSIEFLEIDVTDRYGHRPVRIRITGEDGIVSNADGGAPISIEKAIPLKQTGTAWRTIRLTIDVPAGRFDVAIDGQSSATAVPFAEYVKSVERLTFRTGPVRSEPTLRTATADTPDVAETGNNPDEGGSGGEVQIDDVRIIPE